MWWCRCVLVAGWGRRGCLRCVDSNEGLLLVGAGWMREERKRPAGWSGVLFFGGGVGGKRVVG